MFRKITLLLSASMFSGQHWPHNSKSTVDQCVVEVPTLGQHQYFNRWNLSVGPMIGQCQHANNDVLPTTPTITQCLPTIACYLGTHTQLYTCNFIHKSNTATCRRQKVQLLLKLIRNFGSMQIKNSSKLCVISNRLW